MRGSIFRQNVCVSHGFIVWIACGFWIGLDCLSFSLDLNWIGFLVFRWIGLVFGLGLDKVFL
jgi:hypothetical protein